MTAPADADPIAPLIRERRRNAMLNFAALIGLFVVVGLLVGQGDLGYALSLALQGLAIALVPTLVLIYLVMRQPARLRPLAPLIAEVGWQRYRGSVVVLQDGMVVSVPPVGGFLFCIGFFDSRGATLHPSAAEAIRWTGARSMLRMSRVGFVRRGIGPSALRSELAALAGRIGARAIYSTAYEQRSPPADALAPHRVVIVVPMTITPFTLPPVDRLVFNLPEISAFMGRMLGFPWPGVTPVPVHK